MILPPAGLGDLIMAAPAIRAVRNRFPDAYIAVLAHYSRGAKEIGDCMSYLDEVIDFPLERYLWTSVLRFFASLYWPMFWNLKRRRFDTIINLAQNPIRTILIKMLNPPMPLEVEGKGHPTQRGFNLSAKLGCSTEPLDFGFQVPLIDIEKILPATLPRPWIGVHPFSAIRWRNWSNYADFLENLPKSATVIILGKDPSHKKKIHENTVVDLVNVLSIKELVAVIAKLDMLISIDSGPMHIGFAAGTPTLGIFNIVEPQDRMPLAGTISHQSVFFPHTHKNNDRVLERDACLGETVLDNDVIYSKMIELCRLNKVCIPNIGSCGKGAD